MDTHFDLIVIGGGPGGYEAALHAAKLGLRTALIEKDTLGGTCLNRGCVPTKAMLHAAGLYAGLREAQRWGISVQGEAVDFAAMQARKNEIVTTLRGGIARLLKSAGVAVLAGEGCLLDAHTVRVCGPEGEQRLQARYVLLATGSVPGTLPLPGADLPGVWNSDRLLTAERIPASLVIVGGGVIGVEFASVFAALGSRVTVIEAADRLLPGMDREIAQNLTMIFKKRGVALHTGASVQRFEPTEAGVRCVYVEKEAQVDVEGETVLVCVGRKPFVGQTLAVGCGLVAERGAVRVDARGRTGLEGVWAIGDVTGGIQLAHYATAQGIVAVEDMAGVPPSIRIDVVPSCVYTDPEIACVGITADQAKEMYPGRAVRSGKCVLGGNARTMIAGAERSFIKVVADADSGVLLGAQLMCERASDLIGEFATAITHEMTVTQLHEVLRAHPTFYEAARDALSTVVKA